MLRKLDFRNSIESIKEYIQICICSCKRHGIMSPN